MKKLLGLSLIAMIFVFSSCEELGLGSLPIEHGFEETFTLTFDENTPTHFGDTVSIDLSELDDFADITGSIDSMEITKIALKFVAYNGPEDLYLAGVLAASDDEFENTSVTVGEVDAVNVNEYFTNSQMISLDIDAAIQKQLTDWLMTNNKATVAYDFGLLGEDMNEFAFVEEDFGKSLTVEVMIDIKAYVSSLPDFGF